MGGRGDARDRLGGALLRPGLDAARAYDGAIFGDDAECELRTTEIESEDFTHAPSLGA